MIAWNRHWLCFKGKTEKQLPFIAISLQIFWQTFQKCSMRSSLQSISFLCKLLNLIGCPGNENAQIWDNIKINSSEAIWPMKLKLCTDDLSVSFYQNTASIAVALAHLLLWQLIVSNNFWWKKWKTIFTAIPLQACSLGSSFPNINFCANVYIWLVAIATKSLKFGKIFEKLYVG